MTHELVWTLEHQSVVGMIVCGDTDCIYRYTCEFDCEWLYDVKRAEDGSVSHDPSPYDEEKRMRHAMTRGDECNFALFLNEDTYMIPELFDGTHLEIARTPIEPVWQGEDGALWKVAGATS